MKTNKRSMNGIPEMHGINVDKWHEMPLYRSRCLEVVQVFSLAQVFSYVIDKRVCMLVKRAIRNFSQVTKTSA